MGRRRDYRPGGKKATADGFDSFLGRLGMGQDNMLAASGYTPGRYVTRSKVELDDMYRSSWVVGRMIDVVAEDMISGGVEIRSQMDPGDKEELLRQMRRTGVHARLTDAIKWGGLYGGAIAVILIDGEDLSTPLDVSAVAKGHSVGFTCWTRHQITPLDESITELGPMLGYPAGYRVHAEALRGQTIHHSRASRFVGVELPDEARRSEQYWGGSMVDRAYDRILALDSATHGSANMLYRSFLRVIGVEDLRASLAAGGLAEQSILRMFSMVRKMQSNEGITLLDKNDTFTTHGWTFAPEHYDALQAFSEQILRVHGHSLGATLWGSLHKGLAHGESDLRTYYDTISTKQEDDLHHADGGAFCILSQSIWGRPLPDGFDFVFRSLYRPTETESDSQSPRQTHKLFRHSTPAASSPAPMPCPKLRDSSRTSGRFERPSGQGHRRGQEKGLGAAAA
jgi:phage-related protein (TIGR01555 family)